MIHVETLLFPLLSPLIVSRAFNSKDLLWPGGRGGRDLMPILRKDVLLN